MDPGDKPKIFLQLGAQRQGEPLDAPDRPVPRWVLSGFPWFENGRLLVQLGLRGGHISHAAVRGLFTV